MPKYKLLIIDDDISTRREAYQNVLAYDGIFGLDYINSVEEMDKIENESYHGIVIDVVLDKWHLNLEDIIKRIGDRAPIILVSNQWLALEDIKLMSILNNIIDTNVKHFLSWSEFIDAKGTISKPDVAGAIRWKILNELDRHFRRSKFIPKENETLNILHISDLQFGDPEEDKSAFLSEKAIGNHLRKNHTKPHFLVISGDIAYSGRPFEYELALIWLRNLLKELWPDEDMRERILLVPGNHDVNLRFCSADFYSYKFNTHSLQKIPIKFRNHQDHQVYALTPFKYFAYNLTGDINWLSIDNSLCWISDRFLHFGLRFLHINSAGQISMENPDSSIIHKASLQKLVDLDKSPWIEDEKALFKIAISHHGPRFGDPKKIKPYDNWEEIKNFFEMTKVDMLIHGHGHKWQARTLQEGNEIFNMVITMAPTTHLNNKLRPDGERRGFSIINLLRESGRVYKIAVNPYEMDEARIWPRPDVPRTEWDAPKTISHTRTE